MTAVEIKILSTHAVIEVFSELGPAFERTTGHRLSISYDPTNVIKRQIDGGAAFDVAIVTRPVIDDWPRRARSSADTCVDIGRSDSAWPCARARPSPTSARSKPSSARCSPPSRSCAPRTAPAACISRRCSTASVSPRPCAARSGWGKRPHRRACRARRSGIGRAADRRTLPVTGAEFVGPFPPELQLYTVFAAGVGSASQHRASRRGLHRCLDGAVGGCAVQSQGA